MKKIIIVSLCLLVYGCAGFQKAEKADFKNLKQVKKVSLSKDQIFKKSMLWLETSFTNSKTGHQYSDRKAGLISFQGSIVWAQPADIYDTSLIYKLIIRIKNKKYKIEMIPVQAIRLNHISEVKKMMIEPYTNEFNRINKKLYEYITGKTDDF